MKKMHTIKAAFMLLCLLSVQSLTAQTIYTFDNDELGAPGSEAVGVTASDLTPVNGAAYINACGTGYSSDTWSTSSGAFSTAYSALQLTLTPDAGYTMYFTSIQFDLGRNPQGPARMRYAYSLDGGGSWIDNGSDLSIPSGSCGSGTTFTWDMADFSSTSAVIFRIYGWDAGNVNGQERNYNGSVGGTVCSNSPATMSPAGIAITCKGEPVTFTTDACVGCTYQWYKNDNPLAGATGTSYATTKPAYYNVLVTQANGCSAYSAYTELNSGFNPNANIYHPNGLNLCSPTPGTNIIVKVGFLATNTYQWYKNGVEYTGDGATSWRIFPSETGEYRCSITSIDGCNRVTDIANVTNVCREAEMEMSGFEVYPNPTSGEFNINMNLSASVNTADIVIVNMIGDVVYSNNTSIANGILNASVNLQNATAGLYLVKIIAGGNEYNKQIVINK